MSKLKRQKNKQDQDSGDPLGRRGLYKGEGGSCLLGSSGLRHPLQVRTQGAPPPNENQKREKRKKKKKKERELKKRQIKKEM